MLGLSGFPGDWLVSQTLVFTFGGGGELLCCCSLSVAFLAGAVSSSLALLLAKAAGPGWSLFPDLDVCVCLVSQTGFSWFV